MIWPIKVGHRQRGGTEGKDVDLGRRLRREVFGAGIAAENPFDGDGKT